MKAKADPVPPDTVLKWFKEAWPRKKRYPNLSACQSVAIRLQIVRDVNIQKPPNPHAIKSKKYGGLFSTHAQVLLPELEDRAAWYKSMGAEEIGYPDYNDCQLAIAAIHEAQQSVRTALDAWRSAQPRQPKDHVHFIKEAAQEAWRQTGEKPPVSVNDDDPLCKFILIALEGIGMSSTTHNISAVLRGRHNTRR